MAYVLQTNIADPGKPEAWRTMEHYEDERHALAVLSQMDDPTNWRVKSVWDLPMTATQKMLAWRKMYY